MMGTSSKRMKAIREKLWENGPHCHWCGVLTMWPRSFAPGERIPNETASVDHLYTKLNPLREVYPDEFVLACVGCNSSRHEHDLLSSEERWKRQGVFTVGLRGVYKTFVETRNAK